MGSLSQVRRFVAVPLAVAYPLLAHGSTPLIERLVRLLQPQPT